MTETELFKRLEEARATDNLLLDQESASFYVLLECA